MKGGESVREALSKTRLYSIWKNMKYRCYNCKDRKYANYGGRGITVCDEWKNSFQAFAEWALNNGYDDPPMDADKKWISINALTLDRVDSDKGYSPDNCRWVTFQDNRRNRKKEHLEITFVLPDTENFFIGEKLKSARKKAGLTQVDTSELLGISQQTISHWESGFSLPSLEKAFILARLYGVTVDEIIGA